MRKSLLAFFSFILISASVHAADYTIEPKADDAAAIKSRAIPLRFDNSATWGSISQQIYLASELKAEGAEAGDIEAISFYYGAVTASVTAQSRPIQIFLMQVPAEKDSFVVRPSDAKSTFLYVSNTDKTAGTRVYNGALATEAVTTSETKIVKITFDNSFSWDGSSNIVLTVFDMSPTSNTISSTGYTNLRFMISKTDHPRFLSKKWMSTDTDDRATKNTGWIDDISNNLAGRVGEYWTASAEATVKVQSANRSYVNKVDFSITATPAPSTPTGLAASDISMTSASLNWNAASSATSYELQQSANGEDWSDLASSISGTSYSWTSLSASTTYFVRVRAVNAVGNSDWSEAISFMTEAPHTHNGITFSKWSSTTSLPSEAGNYYLNDDVVLEGNYTVPGNLNLCLNGHNVYTYVYNIVVPDEKTLAIYDNIGNGQIYGYYIGNNGLHYGLISVASGGELVLGEGAVKNLAIPESDEISYGIYNNGTFKLSGEPVIEGVDAAIYMLTGKMITIESGKPLTKSVPYSVNSTGQVFTSGWANMNGANPNDYFVSAKSGYNGITLNASGEAQFVKILALDEADSNAGIADGTYAGTINVAMTRSLTSSQYNTFCLPFALTDAQLQEYFGAGYDLEEFVSSSLENDVLVLNFSKVTALEAGKPYLLQPSVNVANPSFEGVTITETSPVDITTTYVDFKGTYSPTALTGGNKNLLFLGANNELFWPETDSNIKGFRAYFEIKGAAQKVAKRARIVQKENTTTGVDQVSAKFGESDKLLRNGQLLIIRDNKTYNVLGQPVQL